MNINIEKLLFGLLIAIMFILTKTTSDINTRVNKIEVFVKETEEENKHTFKTYWVK